MKAALLTLLLIGSLAFLMLVIIGETENIPACKI